MTIEKVIATDVLVIGGGMAGIFAALKAKAHVTNVTLVDKGYAGRSGATHFAEGDFTFFNPDVHSNMDAWIDQMSKTGEYLNSRRWCRTLLEDSYDRYNDLLSYGVRFYKPDDKIRVGRWGVTEHHCMINREYAPTLRQCALDAGIVIIDRIMVSELIKNDGRIVGAIGFHSTRGDLYIFKSKAVVLAAGGSSIKNEAKPIHYWTSDGHAMGYRAGAPIIGKEFIGEPGRLLRSDYKCSSNSSNVPTNTESKEDLDILARFPSFRSGLMGPMGWPTVNSEGGQVISPAWEAHCGRGPLYMDYTKLPPEHFDHARHFFRRLGTDEIDKVGLDIFDREKLKYSAGRESAAQNIHGGTGILPIDMQCASNIPGLYCAGNNCATMVSGAAYSGMGIGLCHATVTGARAGEGAAEYANNSSNITINESVLTNLKKNVCSPMERQGGFSPRWITQILQSFTVPYFILNIKHETRLTAALTFIEFINQHLVPKLKANDPHEWRLAQEIKNMALNAEMSLRASLFRTESRGTHFREDFPLRDDPEWLAWIKLEDDNGEMQLKKEPIDQDNWPDMSVSYNERYPKILPMEEPAVSRSMST